MTKSEPSYSASTSEPPGGLTIFRAQPAQPLTSPPGPPRPSPLSTGPGPTPKCLTFIEGPWAGSAHPNPSLLSMGQMATPYSLFRQTKRSSNFCRRGDYAPLDPPLKSTAVAASDSQLGTLNRSRLLSQPPAIRLSTGHSSDHCTP